MKRKLICVGLLGLSMFNIVGCNTVAKNFGGTTTIELPENKKLIECTWKDSDSLWYLTRDMKENEIAETYEFKEDSNFGLLEGTVILKESKN